MGIGRDALREIDSVARQLVKTAGQTFWTIVCYFYIAMWSLAQPLREAITSSATVVLLLSSFLFLVEAISLFTHAHLTIPLPLWLKILVTGLAIWMVSHRWKEIKQHRRAGIFATTVAEIFEQVAALDVNTGNEDERKQRLDGFVVKVLVAFTETFDPSVSPQLNIMMLDEEENLKIFYQYPHDVEYEPNLVFQLDEGGCGKAFVTNTAIYIPSIKFRVGISISFRDRKFKLAGLVYLPTEHEPYKCILSVPIRSGSGEVLGILNIDGIRRNCFGMFDLDVAHVASSALAMSLDNYRNRSIP